MLVALAAALVAIGPTYEPKVLDPKPGNPTDADKAVLLRATKECHLHEGAIYFIQYDVPREPTIKMTRTMGDTEQQMECALRMLPQDFNARFATEFEPAGSK